MHVLTATSYYVGYAKFFDVSDRSCDAVSWHIWLNLFTREYLTLERRIGMNGVVDRMNNALRDAVSRAGPQVHFIDYDQYVGDSNGRYCQPATDESSGNSANRRDLFFYEMKSIDSPWLEVEEKTDWHDELRRRGNGYNDDGDDIPINGTLNALYGALIQQTLEGVTDIAALDYWNTDNDLGAEVGDDKRDPSKRSIHPSEDSHMPVPPSVHRWSARNHNGTQNVNHAALGSTVTMNNGSLVHTNNRAQGFGNSTSGVSSVGTVIANGTHVILSNGQPVPKFNIKKLFISDQTSRIFHPTQLGHSIVANLILYKMAAQRASELGITNFPSQDVTTSGDSPPQIGGAACSTDASDTWASRDPMISALKSFCAVPSNLRGTAGQSTSGTFNPGGFDYMSVSIEWNATANLGQHSCEAWLETVTDGCDVPGDGRNVDNMKHGGIIAYDSKAFDATLSITPLVVRQIWDKGQAGGQSCNPMDSHNYLDHDTLQSNIDDYCQKSAAQAGGIANSGQKFEQVYNDGTPDRVVLSTEWPEGPRNYQIWQTECTYYMGVLNNDCSIGGDANPMNWKHGGAMSDNNGVKYTITPTQERPPPPSSPQGFCQAQRTWWGYNWDVYGGGFESSDHGTELSRQISGCGAVTQFKFDYFTTPDGNKEWHASGTLPLFISDHCLGAAVASSGGYSMNC